MGFYIRKSVSLGPLRFNLSKSGIGVSTGIKGLRIGMGPRGNYVQMGRGGIYFRQSLPTQRKQRHLPETPPEHHSSIEFRDIESGSTSQMVDSSSAGLLEEISTKSKKIRIWPWVLALGCCLILGLALLAAPIWVLFVVIPICAGAVVWSVFLDRVRKTVVLCYSLEPHIEDSYQAIHNAIHHLRNLSRLWHITSRGMIMTDYDWKVNAGANALIRRTPIAAFVGSPPYFQCNISIPCLPAGRQKLYFLPDRMLVWDTYGVGAISYEELSVNHGEQRFIETEHVPRDGHVVDHTWRFVNKSGAPDRRFNDNRQIPIVLYDAIFLTSKSGLREMYHGSRIGAGAALDGAVTQMAASLAQRAGPQEDETFFTCPCNHCGVHIEFPSHGVGQSITCPHCTMETVLFKPEAPSSL